MILANHLTLADCHVPRSSVMRRSCCPLCLRSRHRASNRCLFLCARALGVLRRNWESGACQVTPSSMRHSLFILHASHLLTNLWCLSLPHVTIWSLGRCNDSFAIKVIYTGILAVSAHARLLGGLGHLYVQRLRNGYSRRWPTTAMVGATIVIGVLVSWLLRVDLRLVEHVRVLRGVLRLKRWVLPGATFSFVDVVLAGAELTADIKGLLRLELSLATCEESRCMSIMVVARRVVKGRLRVLWCTIDDENWLLF